MILYFSGNSSKIVTQFMRQHKCARLFSYYTDKRNIESRICDNVFVDCGAWTAFTKGVHIDIDEYLRYLKIHRDCYKIAASLDVIPQFNFVKSADDSYDNFIYMRHNLPSDYVILPTYHRGESVSSLRRLLSYSDDYGSIDYIGIGAIANNVDVNMRTRFLDSVFNIIYEMRPDIKIHLFGLTDLSLLLKYPVYSADSTTWALAGAMGEIITDFGRLGVSEKNFSSKSIYGYSREQIEIVEKYVNGFGFSLDELRQSNEHRKMFNILYMKRKVDILNSYGQIKNYRSKRNLF